MAAPFEASSAAITVTVAPGTTAPLGSVTVTRSVPAGGVGCAAPAEGERSARSARAQLSRGTALPGLTGQPERRFTTPDK
jgi:hypothetical protein